MKPRTIYHMCRRDEWERAGAAGVYRGSSQDAADGFIHFSTAAQIEASAARHRAGQKELVLLAVDGARLGDALRWEESQNGDLFPHLWGALPLDAVSAVFDLPLGSDGAHVFPPLERSAGTVSGPVTRFAPSPTGYLHLGHAYSALFAAAAAGETGGRLILRIEDIDRGRCRPEFETAILDDLAWLGLTWARPVRRQSAHLADYARALDRLRGMELIYPCFCTRRDIRDEIARAGAAPHGADGVVYPGICRGLSRGERADRIGAGEAHALRIDMARAVECAGALTWSDRARGAVAAEPEIHGDVVLARKDIPTSYHLAVTVDDHLQQVNLVTRGEDLFAATHIHRLLQALLGFEVPDYHHHRLVTGEDGRRFAKRDSSVTIRALRRAGKSPEEVRRMAGFG